MSGKFERASLDQVCTRRSWMLKVRFQPDNLIEAGIDEAGRGCLWGPLYAAAVIWPPEAEWLPEHHEVAPQIRDSKKLSAKKRAALALAIPALAIDFGVGVVAPGEMDQHGMTWANREVFVRAVQSLNVPPDRLLLDGCLALTDEQRTSLQVTEQHTIVEGDAEYLSIAAASILAKEARDNYVREQVSLYPEWDTMYGLKQNKGYGTEQHRDGILKHGQLAGHRTLFLRKLLNKKDDCLIQDEDA